MKKKALIAAVLAATTLSVTTAFAAENPFKDLPEGHWAYDAVTMLAQDGVIDGYGDGNFNGDKLMNRYEMAEIVSKAVAKYDGARPQDKGAIKKLEKEFSSELKDMDIRLKGVEDDVKALKKGQSSFKWFGDARIRYFNNQNGTRHSDLRGDLKKDTTNTDDRKRTESRIRLGLYGEPAPNLSVTGQLKADDTNNKTTGDSGATSGSSTHNAVTVNRMQLDWNAKNQLKVTAGRMWQNLGQGLIWWENPIDGFAVEKNFNGKGSLMVGVGDIAPENWSSKTEYAVFANAKAKISPAVELTAAYMSEHSDNTVGNVYIDKQWDAWHALRKGSYSDDNNHSSYNTKYDFGFVSLGVNAKINNKWSVIAEGIHNTKQPGVTTDNAEIKNVHNNGFWTRLMYGKLNWAKQNTWQLYGEYFALGGNAIDSTGWGHRLNVSGGNGYGGDGARGWGLGVSYMVADNTNMELTYYKMKPYDEAGAGFGKYDNMGYLSLCYSF